VPLACTASAELQLTALLGPVELARAERFSTPDERRRHVVSHAVLQLILSAFTGCDPRFLHIATTVRGKPYLVDRGPHFSLSHDGDVALIAVTRCGNVGVDVERVRPDLRLDEFAGPLVPVADVTRIEALPLEARTHAWFQAWTRLEAVAKASGDGIQESRADFGGSARFRTWNLDVDEARVGAVAAVPSVTRVMYEALPGASAALARFAFA
jgi:4'-phosphopantetheinyl transferase